jgi:hypothetical protein
MGWEARDRGSTDGEPKLFTEAPTSIFHKSLGQGKWPLQGCYIIFLGLP